MSKALDELMKRCEEAQLEYSSPDSEESHDFWVYLPKGRETCRLFVLYAEAAEALLPLPFEKWKAMAGYKAVWSPELATIECALDPAGFPSSSPTFRVQDARQMLEELGYETGPESLLAPGSRMEFALEGGLSVSIGPAGNFHRLLLWNSNASISVYVPYDSELDEDHSAWWNDDDDMEFDHDQARLTLRIEGVHVFTHDDAIQVLRRVSDSVLFGLDLSLGLSLGLARGERDSDARSLVALDQQTALVDAPPLPPVRYEYDNAPMSLYWYAKGASEMPLLRFLALYQILEYYFPAYSERRAQGNLRNILKNPTFDPDHSADVARLLRVAKAGTGGRGVGGEAMQLKATIEECVSAKELSDFLFSDEERYRFYTSDAARKVVRERIQVREKSEDHRDTVAKRIYALRNRIVHTKGGVEGEEPLFPFDPEVAYLGHDLDLVSFLARKVLISSSRPLRL